MRRLLALAALATFGVLGCVAGAPKMAPPRRIVSMVQRPPSPDRLSRLCKQADTIVVGRATGIVRTDHAPVNAPQSNRIITVCEVAVERYLKTDGAPQQPATLKVAQEGGTLGGLTYLVEDDPLLNVGDRYLLFLQTNNTPEFQRLGGVTSCVAGTCGFWAYLDEYRVAEHLQGKVLLKGGQTAASDDPVQGQMMDWKFRDGGSLLGLPEDEAIAAVQDASRASG
jgi:hypothetical protein